MKEFVRKYREHINPPYSRRDIPAILITLFLFFMVPITVVNASKLTSLFSRASSDGHVMFVNPQTLQAIESTASPQVFVLLTSSWPVASGHGGEVAGLMAQKQPQDTSNQTGTAQSVKDKPKDTVTSSPAQPKISATPTQKTTSILLAEDANFTQNVVTISPVSSNPLLPTYTFSDNRLGTKTLYAKFISSTGSIEVYNRSIQLVTSSVTTTPSVTGTPNGIRPYLNAPLCSDAGSEHNNTSFHTLWDPVRGCHYDHEHGQNPFTNEVGQEFPGFDLKGLLGDVEIGHTTLSSPMENTHKHGGFKWQVGETPQGCVGGFEGAVYCVSAYAIEFHNFGDYLVEMEARIHTTSSLLKVCDPANPSDCGFMYVVQFQDYGQRISGYQGDLLPYPNSPTPAYTTGLGPYLSVDCLGVKAPGLRGTCFSSLDQIRSQNRNVNSIWTSKKTGSHTFTTGSSLFKLLFRIRDVSQVVKWSDDGSIPTYPFTFLFICGGDTYNPVGCRWNNSTSTINEVAGVVPASWDGASFDRDPRSGRVTADGYVTRFGQWNSSCTIASVANDCFPIKMVGMYTGFYGSELSADKVSNPTPENTPERDIYFCNGIECKETDANSVPSGWIGPSN